MSKKGRSPICEYPLAAVRARKGVTAAFYSLITLKSYSLFSVRRSDRYEKKRTQSDLRISVGSCESSQERNSCFFFAYHTQTLFSAGRSDRYEQNQMKKIHTIYSILFTCMNVCFGMTAFYTKAPAHN